MTPLIYFLQDGNTTERRINMPLRSLAERPCVQVKAVTMCRTEKGVSRHFSLFLPLLWLFRRCGSQILLFVVKEFCARTVSVS